jgi:branched-chain amino acid transport system substrate-binding protein
LKPNRICTCFVVVIAGAVLGAPAKVQAQQPIRIGVSVSQTGAYADLGQTVHRGQALCVKDANQRGGVLGRRLELLAEDDESQPKKAAAIYDRLITQTKVDAVFSPYSSPITDAVAELTEKHRMPLVGCCAAASSLYKKGRRFLFMLLSPAESYLEGLVDLAAKRGLKSLAVVHEDTIFPKTIAQGAVDFAKKRGLQVVAVEGYPAKTTDFSAILRTLKAANPDVVAAATYVDDSIAITRQMKALDLNPKMFGVTVGGDLPKFYQTLGSAAEFVYGASQWEPDLVTLRAGGLVPIARQYPGAREFVEMYVKEYPGADLSYQTAQGYSACQVLLEGIKRAGTLDGERVRDAIAKMDLNNAFGAFKVDEIGVQVAHKMVMFQWQDGKKVIVWPDELAPGRPRFPTPPWGQR